jgi:hypothetical protein
MESVSDHRVTKAPAIQSPLLFPLPTVQAGYLKIQGNRESGCLTARCYLESPLANDLYNGLIEDSADPASILPGSDILGARFRWHHASQRPGNLATGQACPSQPSVRISRNGFRKRIFEAPREREREVNKVLRLRPLPIPARISLRRREFPSIAD